MTEGRRTPFYCPCGPHPLSETTLPGQAGWFGRRPNHDAWTISEIVVLLSRTRFGGGGMTVALEFIDFIVPIKVIRAKYPGGAMKDCHK